MSTGLDMSTTVIDQEAKLTVWLDVTGIWYRPAGTTGPLYMVDRVRVTFRGEHSLAEALADDQPDVYATRVTRIRADGTPGKETRQDHLLFPRVMVGSRQGSVQPGDAAAKYARLIEDARQALTAQIKEASK